MDKLQKFIVPINVIVYGEDETDAITYVEEALDNSSFIQEDGIIGVEVMADDVELFEEEEESYEDDMEEDYNEN
mgnify:CR=1 FL=1|jgi:hypothetical protein